MHRGDHSHHHGGSGGHHHHGHDHGMPGEAHGLHGHNGLRQAVQWQTPHRPAEEAEAEPSPLRDLDLVEAAFVEGFSRAGDVTSFLRLAGIPFVGRQADGRRLHLLRVEIDDLTDIGSVVPLLGGAGMRYDPLPTRFVSRRRSLAFAYHDGQTTLHLDFAAARALTDVSDASHFEMARES